MLPIHLMLQTASSPVDEQPAMSWQPVSMNASWAMSGKASPLYFAGLMGVRFRQTIWLLTCHSLRHGPSPVEQSQLGKTQFTHHSLGVLPHA